MGPIKHHTISYIYILYFFHQRKQEKLLQQCNTTVARKSLT